MITYCTVSTTAVLMRSFPTLELSIPATHRNISTASTIGKSSINALEGVPRRSHRLRGLLTNDTLPIHPSIFVPQAPSVI